MARKSTFLNTVFLDWDQRNRDEGFDGKVRGRADWEEGVINTLEALYRVPPCDSGKAVIDDLVSTGKSKGMSVTIVPFTLRSWETATAALRAKVNAGAVADDIPAATVAGKLSDDLPDSVPAKINSAPDGPERDKMRQQYLGTGRGSSSHLKFTAQFFADPSPAVGLDAADETLLHELIHSLRQEKGQEDPDHLRASNWLMQGGEKDGSGSPTPVTALSQVYDTLEEFAAILFTNIYRSENGRRGLRSQHIADAQGQDAPLPWPLTKPRNFLTFWRPQILRLSMELPSLCKKLSQVVCPFNPLLELYRS
jgi:hypothetical protein